MGRLYEGLWRVLLVTETVSGTERMAFTQPDVYEECERRCILHGMGVPYEGERVKRALIVGPVEE